MKLCNVVLDVAGIWLRAFICVILNFYYVSMQISNPLVVELVS